MSELVVEPAKSRRRRAWGPVMAAVGAGALMVGSFLGCNSTDENDGLRDDEGNPTLQELDPPGELGKPRDLANRDLPGSRTDLQGGALPPPRDDVENPPANEILPPNELPPPTPLHAAEIPGARDVMPSRDFSQLVATLPPPWTEGRTFEAVQVYDEFSDKAPTLFDGFQEVLPVKGYKSVGFPRVRIVEATVDDKGRSWISYRLKEEWPALVDSVAGWMRSGFASLAKGGVVPSSVEESAALDELAKNVDSAKLSQRDRERARDIVTAKAVLFIELKVRFFAEKYVGNPAIRNQHLMKANYNAYARLVDVERGTIVWAREVEWSRTFVLANR